MRVGRIEAGVSVAAGRGAVDPTAAAGAGAASAGSAGGPAGGGTGVRRAVGFAAVVIGAALPHVAPGAAAGTDPLGRLLLHLPRAWRAPAIVWFTAACLLIRMGHAALATAVVLGGLAFAAAWTVWRQVERDLRHRRVPRRTGAA